MAGCVKMKRALVTLLILCSLGPVAANDWKRAQPDYAWTFPRDHWSHEGYKTEWWYFTGHLRGADGRRFGYQFTFFRVGVLPKAPEADSGWSARDLIMGHAAVSDLDRNEHRFSEVIYRAVPLLGGFGAWPEPLIAWSRAPAGTPGKWLLSWNGDGFDITARDDATGMSFTLSSRPGKPLVFQGPNGYSRKTQSGDGASLYYSFTRLQTSGRLTLDGRTWQVSGESWMDKEFFTSVLEPQQIGWDWFSLQLDDRREVMLFLLRQEDGSTDFAGGTVISADGERHLPGPRSLPGCRHGALAKPAHRRRLPVALAPVHSAGATRPGRRRRSGRPGEPQPPDRYAVLLGRGREGVAEWRAGRQGLRGTHRLRRLQPTGPVDGGQGERRGRRGLAL